MRGPRLLSPVSHGHPGAYALGPVLLVWPGVACDDAVAWPGPRTLLQGLWIVAALVVLAAALDMLRIRVLPRRGVGHGGERCSNLVDCVVSQFSRHDGDGEPRVVLAARHGPAGGAVGVRRAGSAHRLPLRGLAGGGLPFLAAVYGATVGRLRYRVITVEVPITDLPPHLDGLRIVHLSDIHIGAFMPRAAIRRAVDMSNAVQPIWPCSPAIDLERA